MYNISFTLKQHTPLIHHLGKETWAGLQPKAVIPLLNRFIAEIKTGKRGGEAKTDFINEFKSKCFLCMGHKWNAGVCGSEQCKPKCEYAGWFRNKKDLESLALNYDMHFDCNVDMENSYKEKMMNQEQDMILFSDRKITGSFSCSVPSLQALIKETLPKFFIIKGFGYRSSKGFGCFTYHENGENIPLLAETDSQAIREILRNYYTSPNAAIFHMNIPESCCDSYKKTQNIIAQHWKWIKSGNNPPDNSALYKKSLFWQFFCGQNGNSTGWEKRFIKESLKGEHNDVFKNLKRDVKFNEMRFETINIPGSFQFYRALLGLAEHYEYALQNGNKIDNKSSIKVNVKSKNPDIVRIPSPVKFRVFGNTIYLIVDDIDKEINNAAFEFCYKNKNLVLGSIDNLSVVIPDSGLRDCFVSMLTETQNLDPGHPLCNKYNLITNE